MNVKALERIRREVRPVFAVAVALIAAMSALADFREDMWKKSVTLRKGVTVRAYALEKPRTMKAYVARIDLTTPDLRFTVTERLQDGWRDPITVNKKGGSRRFLAETRLESTVDFVKRRRASGLDVAFAVNASFWGPWPTPKDEMRADPIGICIADGEEVSAAVSNRTAANFVVHRDGKAGIVQSVDDAMRRDLAVAVSGRPMIMKNGRFLPRGRNDINPRTAFGLTANRKTLVILVVDGRQKGYSEGASMRDLYDILRREGVTDAVNMDGGGSSSFVVFDASADSPLMLNRHRGGTMRKTAVNLGIAFGGSSGKPAVK